MKTTLLTIITAILLSSCSNLSSEQILDWTDKTATIIQILNEGK